MEGKFVISFDSKEAYLEGVDKFIGLLDKWQLNADKFDRRFDLVPQVDEDNHRYAVEVVVSVDERV